MKVSFDVVGYYDIYDGRTGNIVSVSKNKICPGFFTSFEDYRHASKMIWSNDYSDFFDNPNITYRRWHSLLVSNQLNLTITKSDDNFSYNDYVKFSEAENKYSMSILGLKPLELIEEETRYRIVTRHSYRLPNKNLGNITGFAISMQNVIDDAPQMAPANRVSVSHVRDEFGVKGTFPHTEDTDTIVVYRLEYLVRKPLNAGVNFLVANDYEQYYGPFGYTLSWLLPNETVHVISDRVRFRDSEWQWHNGFLIQFKRPRLYVYPKIDDMSIRDNIPKVYSSINPDANVPNGGLHEYNKPLPEELHPELTYSTIASNTDTSVRVKAFTSFELLEYTEPYTISDLESDPVKYAKILNHEPYKIRVRFGNLFASDLIEVTTAGLHKVYYSLDINITISEDEQYDE